MKYWGKAGAKYYKQRPSNRSFLPAASYYYDWVIFCSLLTPTYATDIVDITIYKYSS